MCDSHFSNVLPRLYIASYSKVKDLELVKKHNISFIVNAAAELDNIYVSEFTSNYKLQWDDSQQQNILSDLKKVTAFIRDAFPHYEDCGAPVCKPTLS